jgi:hypothetical protein
VANRGKPAKPSSQSAPSNSLPPANKQENKGKEKQKIHPSFYANMWKPGQSGNPSGRPKSKPLTDELRRQLAMKIPGDRKGRTYYQLMIERGIDRATMKSDVLWKEVFDRIEGAVPRIFTDEEGTLERGVRVVVVDVARPKRGVELEDVGPGPLVVHSDGKESK